MDHSPEADSEQISQNHTKPAPRKSRTALACQRCKNRKQKCDGRSPACSNCVRSHADCQYVLPPGFKPGGRFHVAALENRIAELEALLASIGFLGANEDHFKRSQENPAIQQLSQNHNGSWEEQGETDDELLSAIRELSLSTNGHYIGGTSTITLGRLLGSVVRGRPLSISPQDGLLGSITFDELRAERLSNSTLTDLVSPFNLPESVGETLLAGYTKHISTRFPVLHTPQIRALHHRRHMIDTVYDEAILHLVYATSGLFLESTGQSGPFFCDHHYDAALEHMDSILGYGDRRSVVYLALLAIFNLRASKDLGAWRYAGLSMRICIELGLHRRLDKRKLTISGEMDKRTFWACYYLDREVSIAMGRPPAISDNDIDAEFPFDIDENVEYDAAVSQAARDVSDKPRSPPTSLTSFVHQLRLKQIESQIQNLIYRVDKPFSDSKHLIEQFLSRLGAWHDVLPPESREFRDMEAKPFDGIDVYLVTYYRVRRLLLFPTLSESPLNIHCVALCAEACGGVCEHYKRLHHSLSLGFSPLSIQNVFLAGLTLAYCMWLLPDISQSLKHTAQLTDCSIMLYVMTERYPSARKYRDVFENIKRSILDILAEPQQQQRAAGANNPLLSGTGIRDQCGGLHSEAGTKSAQNEIDWMIGELMGERIGFNSEQAPYLASEQIPDQLAEQKTGDTTEMDHQSGEFNLVDGAGDWDTGTFEF